MEMPGSVTAGADCDQVFFGIISKPAAGAEVMDLKISRRAAVLAAPPITREHLAGEPAIRFGFEAQSRRGQEMANRHGLRNAGEPGQHL